MNRRRAVWLGGPMAVADGAITASEYFTIRAIIGKDTSVPHEPGPPVRCSVMCCLNSSSKMCLLRTTTRTRRRTMRQTHPDGLSGVCGPGSKVEECSVQV